MDKQSLIDKLKGNEPMVVHVGDVSLSDIYRFAPIEIKMDRQTMDYYWSINVDKLLDNNITEDNANTLKDQGWAYVNGELVLYMTN